GVVMRGKTATIAEDGTRTEQEFASGDELQKLVKANDWNDYEIVAKGSRIVLSINGQRMCEVDDRDAQLACKKGILALQMHPGPPMKVQFRNLRIQVTD
ncbi:MAG: 3-keto-disaccharide hydrolase, partial [Thermoguttaceae bacterium]